jgi:hypothetical protein
LIVNGNFFDPLDPAWQAGPLVPDRDIEVVVLRGPLFEEGRGIPKQEAGLAARRAPVAFAIGAVACADHYDQ